MSSQNMQRREFLKAAGVAAGLAYTPAGGDELEIYETAVPCRRRLQLTVTPALLSSPGLQA